jgi:hypothetical protein
MNLDMYRLVKIYSIEMNDFLFETKNHKLFCLIAPTIQKFKKSQCHISCKYDEEFIDTKKNRKALKDEKERRAICDAVMHACGKGMYVSNSRRMY